MPTRTNPYYGSANTYTSRGMMPGAVGARDSIATPLAQLVGGILDAATYDPSLDLNAQQASKLAREAAQAKDRDIVTRQQASVMNDPTVSLSDIASSLVGFGHYKPEDAGKFALLANAARGPRGQNMDDAQTGAALWEVASGTPGGSTFNASTYGVRQKPIATMGPDGRPAIMSQQEAIDTGAAPVLNEGEVKGSVLASLAADMSRPEKLAAVGAEPRQNTPYNYVKTGPNGDIIEQGSSAFPPMGPNVTVFTGQVQPSSVGGLTNKVKSDVQSANLALKNFKDLTAAARQYAQDPTVFGTTGNVRRFAQDAQQQLQNIGMLVGSKSSDLDGIYRDALANAAANGVDVNLLGGYDPGLSDIVKVSTLLRYAGASALAGQSGRSVSNEDVKQFAGVVGDPTSWLSTQQKYLSGLDLMDSIAGNMEGNNNAALGNRGGLANAAVNAIPLPPAAPPRAAPAVPGTKPPQEMTDEELMQHLGRK